MPERRLLDTTELFATLPESVRDDLRTHATPRSVARGEELFCQNDPANELFYMLEGRIAIVTRAADGRETVVAVLEDGSLLGELGLFDGAPRSADARALADSEVLILDYESVRAALNANPHALWFVMRILAQRLRATDEALADAVFLDVPARTAKRLLELAGESDTFRLPMTQEDLAGLVGASRERVNKAIALFSKLGWLEVSGRNHYRILDRAALQDRANS